MADDGTAKKMSATRRLPMVRVVKEKSKKPEPLELNFGGLTNIETNSNTHHKKVMTRKMTSNHLKARTLHKLYGDTAGSSGLRYPCPPGCCLLCCCGSNLVLSFVSSDCLGVSLVEEDEVFGLSPSSSCSSSALLLVPHRDTIAARRERLSALFSKWSHRRIRTAVNENYDVGALRGKIALDGKYGRMSTTACVAAARDGD